MNKTPRVSIVSKSKISKQWMKGLFHQNRIKALPSKWAPGLWVLVAISASIPFGSHFTNAGVKIPAVEKTRSKSESYSISLPELKSSDDKKRKVASSRNRKVVPRTFIVAKSIDRPSLGTIPPGALIKAKLLSGASNGPITAKTTEALRIDGETFGFLLEQKFVGSGASETDRLQVRFKAMVFRDGKTKPVVAIAADISDKIAGLKGSKVGGYGKKLAAATGLNFLSGYSEGLKKKEVDQGQVVEKSDARNALLNGASFAAIDLSREVLSSMRSGTPPIEVPSGKEIFILFEEAL